MKVGKVSESILKRSVLKQIKSIETKMVSGAGVGADCAIFAQEAGSFSTTTQACVLEAAADIRYVFVKTANNIACSGGTPFAVQLSLMLPETAEEVYLAEIMKAAKKAAEELNVQIAGGHTEVTAAVSKPVITVTMTGVNTGSLLPGGAKTGQDIVISKWIGLEGTAKLAGRYRDRLLMRYPYHLIDEAAAYDRYLSVIPEAATAMKSNVSAMHDVSTGGIFAALWELAESAGVGLTIDLKKIPVKQETVEVCEFFGISPYELLSGGSLLMVTDNGDHLVQTLAEAHIPAAVIGKITADNDRVVVNEEERRFLERPRTDEINKMPF